MEEHRVRAHMEAAELQQMLRSDTWQKYALSWSHRGMRVVTGAEATKRGEEESAVGLKAARSSLSALHIFDKLTEDAFESIAASFAAGAKKPARGPAKRALPAQAVRSIGLFYAGSSHKLAPRPLTEAVLADLPYYRATDGTVQRWTKHSYDRFVRDLTFAPQPVFDLFTSATIECICFPGEGLVSFTADESIIDSDMRDPDVVAVRRKSKAGFLCYTLSLHLPLTRKPLALRILAAFCLVTSDGAPRKEPLKPAEAMRDAAQFLHGLQRTHNLPKDGVLIVMDAYLSQVEMVLREWEAYGFMGSIGLKKSSEGAADLLGHHLLDGHSRMISVDGQLISVYKNERTLVLNASTAFKCSEADTQARYLPHKQPVAPLHSLEFAALLDALYGQLEGDILVLDSGLLRMPHQTTETVLPRATGWTREEINSFRPRMGFVQALEGAVEFFKARAVAGSQADGRPAAAERLPVRRTALQALGPRREDPRPPPRAPEPTKMVDWAVCRLLADKGYCQEPESVPKWSKVVDCAKDAFGLRPTNGENRRQFKERLLGAAGVSFDSHPTDCEAMPATDDVELLEVTAAEPVQSDTVALDHVLPPGWRGLVPSEEELSSLSQEQLEAKIRDIHMKAKIPDESARKIKLIRSLAFKRLVDPSFIRETITCASFEGKTPPQVFHEQHCAGADKLAQYQADARSTDTIRKKMIRIFRWLVEAAVVHTHSLVAKARYKRDTQPEALASVLAEIMAAFKEEQEALQEEYSRKQS